MSDIICSKCGAHLICPECLRSSLRKCGTDHSTRKQRYECKSCGRHTIALRCPICHAGKHPEEAERKRREGELSESGRRCLICDTELGYCPECGRDQLVLFGTRTWVRKDGTHKTKQMYKCGYCRRVTVNPTCDCNLPNMSEVARLEMRRRLRLKRGYDGT